MKALEWFYQRDRREQVILACGAVFVALYILWFGVLQPLSDMRYKQEAANVDAVERLTRVKTMAAQLKNLSTQQQPANTSSGRSIADLVDQTLRRNNLTMKGFQPSSSGEVKLRLDGVRFDNLMQWIYDLEFQYNVEVRELSVVSGNGPGQVVANVRLFKQ